MLYNNMGDEVWTLNNGDWIGSKYYNKEELLKTTRRRNIVFIASFILYLIVSAALIMF